MRCVSLSVLSSLCLAWGLSACSPSGPGPQWLPLQAGQSQRFAVRFEGVAEHEDTVWTIRTLGEHRWDGEALVGRQHSEGVTFWLKADAQGVRRLAHQTELDREPLFDEKPQWVLKAPYSAGTEWSTVTVPYLLMRKNEHPRALKHTHKVQMNWWIESDKAEVKLASGRTLAPCLHVKGEAFLNLYTDPVNGFTDVPLVSHEWYCQGQGLVKFSREETVTAGFLTGGKMVAEWID